MSALGIDQGVAMMLLARGWSVLSGALTIVFIGRYLTPEVQGYYFTFASLIGLQVVMELGLSYAIVQFASHEMAALSWDGRGTVTGNAGARRRLQSLLHFVLAWFGAAGVLIVLVFVPLGSRFLTQGTGAASGATIAAWHWVVPLSAANLLLGATLSLLEGCGRVAEVAKLRFAQAVAGCALLWAGIAGGAGLFALAAQAAGTLVVGVTWSVACHGHFFRDLLAAPQDLPGVAWRREIWPFQWRIAVSWASGYLSAQLFNPVLFATHGPVVAGQMGLSLQIYSALNLLALAWINAQVPTYGRLIAQNNDHALDHLFFNALAQSTAALLVIVLVLLAGLGALQVSGSPYASRVVSWPQMAWLALVALANHVVYAQAALLRARREDPFMVLSIFHGLTAAGLAFAWVPQHGAAGAVAAHAAATLLVSLPAGTAIFLRRRRAGWSAPLCSPRHS